MKTKKRYIRNAIIWNRNVGENGAWVRIRDLNLIEEDRIYGQHYEPAYSGSPRFIIREAYPYESWMGKYVGTNNDLRKDRHFKFRDEN